MHVTVIKEDNVVVIDGEALNFDFQLDSNIWAIQWNGAQGEIEYNDGTPNHVLVDFSDYQYLIDAHTTEKQRVAEAQTQEEVDRIAAMTYVDKRVEEYPTIEECVHAILDGEVDALQVKRAAVKAKYPKE